MFIEVLNENGEPELINSVHVTKITPRNQELSCTIKLTCGSTVLVGEPYDDVVTDVLMACKMRSDRVKLG